MNSPKENNVNAPRGERRECVFEPRPKIKKTFNFIDDYLSKDQCTSLSFGLEPISQLCYVCPICNPKRDKKLCKFCYDTCHEICREREPENSEKLIQDLNELKGETFSCYCGLKLKHKPEPPERKELVPCNMMQLDQVLSVKSIWCKTHNIQVCCICSVTCHKKCKIIYENSTNAQSCSCRSDFHTNYNELALTFPLNEYKEKTGISVWSIQILNILFSTKNVFQKMSELFIATMNNPDPNAEINESFFPLLELFSNTLNRKFKTFYYNEELIKMFSYDHLLNFMFRLPMDNGKILLVKFRLIFIVLFIHLKADYQNIKNLTSIDFMTVPILDRFRYKIMLRSQNVLTEPIYKKYFSNKNNYLMKIALEEACTLMETGMNYLNIEKNQDEFEIGLKYICFLLKRMAFSNKEFDRLIQSLFSFYEKFFEYLTGDKSNIYGLLSIFNTLAEIFYLICVQYNDNVVFNYIEKKDKLEGFIHTKSESGNMLFKMVLKSCDMLKKHYALLQKPDLDDKSKEEKKREESIRKHMQKMQAKIESTTTGVKLKLPENGGLLVEKIIKMFNETLKFFCLADNIYFQQIEKINKHDLLEYFDFRKKMNKKQFGTFYIHVNGKKDTSNALVSLKLSIEKYLYNLFNGSYTNANLRINDNISSDITQFIKITGEIFEKLNQNYVMLKNRGKIKIPEKEDTIEQSKIEDFTASLVKKLLVYFPYFEHESFDYYKENFVDSLILYSLDETISKLLVFFSARDFPHLLTSELLDQIFALLNLYLLTRNGTQFLISGKILTRVCKVFRRYQCMSNGKNIIPKYHRDLLTNLSYIEKTFDFFYILGKALKVCRLSIKNHKILMRMKNHSLEHLETLTNSTPQIDMSSKLIILMKRHICLSLKIFTLYCDDFEYEDFEDIKKRMMWLFVNCPLHLTESNNFIAQFDTGKDKSGFSSEVGDSSQKKLLRMSTSRLLTPRSMQSETQKLISTNRRHSHGKKSNFSKSNISEQEMMILDSKKEEDETVTIDDLERQINIKMYYAFFNIISKNTYYAYIDSQEEELYDKVFSFNSIEDFKLILDGNGSIALKDRTIVIKFLRTLGFIEHLDKINLFDKKAQLTNQEYKKMIYNNIIHIEGLEDAPTYNKDDHVDEDTVVELNEKFNRVEQIGKVVDLYIMEISNFPSQCQNETITAIEDYVKEMIFGIKFIGDFYYLNYDLVNKLNLKLYILTKNFLEKSDLIKKMLIDIKEKGKISDDYDKIENPKVKEISFANFDVYDKELTYKYLIEEINAIFTETGVNETCSLEKYLDVFDNMAEANFTPFSLIETYDYEYFYQEASNEEEENLLKDKTEALIHKIPTVYIGEFIDITSTNFYNVITSISNESMRVDYRKKLVNYFHAFFNSTEAYLTFKLETLICIIDKMLFYDGDESQGKFSKMRTDKFFFPNLNLQLHQFIILTIISSKNIYIFDRAVTMISLSKLMIQFIQLLGEGFNLDYHDNIFKLQKDILENKKFDEDDEESEEDDDDDDDEEDDEDDDDDDEDNNNTSVLSSGESPINTERSRKTGGSFKTTKSKNNANTALPMGSEENKIMRVDETIYDTLLINLKRTFAIIKMGKEINAELPFDKLIVLTTNIIDFLIEYIDTNEENEDRIIEGMSLLFFGNKIQKTDSYYDKYDKKGLVKTVLFTKISNYDIKECQLRKKLICYVKIKYIQLLISYLQTGKHEDTVVKLIQNRCSPVELFNELLFNFHYMIMQIKEKDETIYKKLTQRQSDEAFVQNLLDVYIYEETFKDLIEFPLCLKLYVLIRTYEEMYNQNMLKDHFEKIMQMKELKQTKELDMDSNIDINSVFSKRIYLFLEKLVLKVEIKNNLLDDDDEESEEKNNEKIAMISDRIVDELQKSKEEGGDDDNKEKKQSSSKKKKNEEPETKITFFVRPYLTFHLSNQSMVTFEEKVDRTNATSKFLELTAFSDYALLEMVINAHMIGKNAFKQFASNFTYIYLEMFNFFIILVHNVFVMIHYYRSPSLSLSEYDVIDESMTYHLFDDNYYLALIQAAFIAITIINWIYFKFLLTYQHCVMKRYNKSFVFRKKGESMSSNISKVIVEYFQNEGSTALSVIREKNKDISFFQAMYVALFDALIFNREICIFIYNLILIALYIKIESSMFLVVPMIFIANVSPTLFDIFKAMTMKFSNMITVLIFTCLIVYLYMWVTYFYMSFLFDFDDIIEMSSGQTIHEVFCNSSVQCFLFMVQQGLRAGGGIGEVLPNMSFQTDPGFFILRFFYDMIFFIFIIMILFNVFMGIIVDTFAELRDDNWSRENDINNICFICQLSRDDCLTKNIDFNTHVKTVHYVWNYVYFLTYLHTNNPNDFNSIENFVWEKLEEQDFGWIPIDSNAE